MKPVTRAAGRPSRQLFGFQNQKTNTSGTICFVIWGGMSGDILLHIMLM